jgi:hypothetical protein
MYRRTLVSTFAVVALVLGLSACDLTVPDQNNPSLNELQNNPTAFSVNSLASGLLIGARDGFETYIVTSGMFGREMYDFDGASVIADELLTGPLNSSQWGGSNWDAPYANLRNATTLLEAVGSIERFSEAQKEAIRGYTKTIMAYEFLILISTRNENGAVIDIDRSPTGDPGPIVGRSEVYANIDRLLSEAKTHLEDAAGSSFTFDLSSGFAGFNTPETFLKFNRALKARAEIYTEDYDAALTALDASFVDTTASLNLGTYHTFGTGSGDASNGLFGQSQGDAPNYVAPSIWRQNVEMKPNGQPDDRFQNKFRTLPSEQTRLGARTDLTFTRYESPSADIPIIRNEELILIRAEANIGLGNYDAARRDLNHVRVNSGGLAPYQDLDASNAIDRLLYERSYSLHLEGTHRWVDYRRYGRLDQLVKEREDHKTFSAFLIPTDECLARDQEVPCGAQ